MAEKRLLKRWGLLCGALIAFLGGFAGIVLGAGALAEDSREPAVRLLERKGNVTLPCKVEGTQLIAKELVMYEGPYLESGGDEPVSDITALILYNSGEEEIGQAKVILKGEDELSFFASNIMPGAQILVLEEEAAPWEERKITACEGWIKIDDSTILSDEILQIREVNMSVLSVTNCSDQTLTDIWVLYKNYLPESKLYIGGITYMVTVDRLLPGQTKQVYPQHYAAGYTRILKAIGAA